MLRQGGRVAGTVAPLVFYTHPLLPREAAQNWKSALWGGLGGGGRVGAGEGNAEGVAEESGGTPVLWVPFGVADSHTTDTEWPTAKRLLKGRICVDVCGNWTEGEGETTTHTHPILQGTIVGCGKTSVVRVENCGRGREEC